MGMFCGMFYRGDPVLIDWFSEEELNEHPDIRKKAWVFEATSLDAAAERALRNQKNYNKGSLGDAMRYAYVADSRGNRKNLFDLA